MAEVAKNMFNSVDAPGGVQLNVLDNGVYHRSGDQQSTPAFADHEQARTVTIPDKLRPMVTQERLAANALKHDVMWLDLSPRDKRQVAAIRERLLGMPLIHASKNPGISEAAKRDGLLTHASGAAHGNTFPIDQSLGLDEYVFFNWGRLDGGYGHNVVLVDARVMFGDCIVTPLDITRCGHKKVKPHAYSDLSDMDRQRLDDKYFGRMLTGRDWLEILARQVHQFAKRKPGYPYPLQKEKGLGEVKAYGSVDRKYIIGELTLPRDPVQKDSFIQQWHNSLRQHGIAFDMPEDVLAVYERMQKYNPEELARFRRAGWQQIMEIE